MLLLREVELITKRRNILTLADMAIVGTAEEQLNDAVLDCYLEYVFRIAPYPKHLSLPYISLIYDEIPVEQKADFVLFGVLAFINMRKEYDKAVRYVYFSTVWEQKADHGFFKARSSLSSSAMLVIRRSERG